MDLRSVLLEIHAALDAEAIEHALIGGLALAAHGAGRATVDLDFIADGVRSDDVARLLAERGYECAHRNEYVGNFVSRDPIRGRIDFLFARRVHGRAILSRAAPHSVLGTTVRVVDASDLIGLKVQSSSNDPRRRPRDVADILNLMRSGNVDLARVREYFQLFDREKELDALLTAEHDE
jgi:hypothetical protein